MNKKHEARKCRGVRFSEAEFKMIEKRAKEDGVKFPDIVRKAVRLFCS